jgi:hypothetical protein
MFWGIASLATGLGKWASSSGEMKALGYQPPPSKLWTRVQRLFGRPTNQLNATTHSLMELPVSSPGVTEHTTRQLDERRDRPQLERPTQNR